MLRIERVLGSRVEPALSEALHRLEHEGAVDIANVPATDLARRRLLITTRGGEELAIALPRHEKLFDGAVLLLEPDRAIVVRAATERWLRLSRARSPTRWSSATTSAIYTGGCGLAARCCWLRWKAGRKTTLHAWKT